MGNDLTITEAYRAMFRFLETYYEQTRSDEIGGLLGGLALTEDGGTMDPAAWDEWLTAVHEVRGAPGPDAPVADDSAGASPEANAP